MFKKFIVFVLLFSSIEMNSQTKILIDEEIIEARKLSNIDFAKAINKYDQIISEASKINYDEAVLDAKDALITIYFNSGNYKKVVENSDEVENLALKLNNYRVLANVFRNIAASYSMLRLNKQSLKNLKKAKIFAQKIKEDGIRHYTLALIYDSYSVCVGLANEDQEEYVNFINKSLNELQKISDFEMSEIIEAKYELIGFQYFRLADFYTTELKDFKIAESYYNKALEIYNNEKYNILPNNRLNLITSLSNFYLSVEKFSNTINVAEQGLQLELKNPNPELRRDLYNILLKANLEIENKEQAKKYAELYTQLNDSIKLVYHEDINASVEKIIINKKTEHTNFVLILILCISIFLIICIFLLWYLLRRRNLKNHKRIKDIISKIKSESRESLIEITSETKSKSSTLLSIENDSLKINDETIQVILTRLTSFEQKQVYLKNEITLAYLANFCRTNTKYLSEILKVYKGSSYKNYVNGLRIKHIIGILYDQPNYREYKIDYLASLCGFSSREIFTKVFKKETGLTPSYFIANIKNVKI